MSTPSQTPEGRLRDHTGAPLPHGASEPPGGFAQEHEVATVEEALAQAVRCWDAGRYFEAHELLEHVWHHAPANERLFWQGVIQVAVVHVLGQRGRPDGVQRMAAKARAKLAEHPGVHHGIDVDALRRQLAHAEELARRGTPAEQPAFPSAPGGPWFDADRESIPLTREAPWLVASRQAAERHEAQRRTDQESDA